MNPSPIQPTSSGSTTTPQVSPVPIVLRFQTLQRGTAPEATQRARSPGRTREAARWLKGRRFGNPSAPTPGSAPAPALGEPRRWTEEAGPVLSDTFRLMMDPEGSTVTYVEPGRRATVLWGCEDGLGIYFDTLETWVREDGTAVPMTDEEQVEVARRVIRHLRLCLGSDVRLK